MSKESNSDEMNGGDSNSDGKSSVTVNEKILLHLKDYSSYRDATEVPKDVTQKGIANAVGILPSHTPRALKRLIRDGLVAERDGYVGGGTRKSRVYFLSDNGNQRTKRLAERIGSTTVEMRKDGKITYVQLCEINMQLRNKLSFLELVMHHGQYRYFDITRIDSGQKIVDFSTKAPRVEIFVDREDEFGTLKALAVERKVVVIFGWKGVGKTALASKYLENIRGKQSVFWYQLQPSDTFMDLLESLAEFLELMGVKTLSDYLKGGKVNMAESQLILLEALSESDTRLIFDNYSEQQGEDIVDFFSLLVNMIKDTKGIGVLITARENIPYYNWFYGKKELEREIVGELHLKGLDRESGKKIIAVKNIEEDAYKQIHQLTKGVPQLLEYIRDDSTDALKASGLFTAQEIRLMLGLKKVVRK
jgi:DNA-binding MarR family transcriptional regulator